MKTHLSILAGTSLALTLACGGGGGSSTPVGPTNATRLTYTEPAQTGWYFTKVSGTGSVTDPLVLELRGPSTPRVKGAAFFMNTASATRLAWHALNGASYVQVPANMTLGAAPQLLKDKLTGSELQVGVFQKTGDAAASGGVVRIALKLKDGSQSQGDITGITLTKTSVLATDGTVTTPAITLGALKAE